MLVSSLSFVSCCLFMLLPVLGCYDGSVCLFSVLIYDVVLLSCFQLSVHALAFAPCL